MTSKKAWLRYCFLSVKTKFKYVPVVKVCVSRRYGNSWSHYFQTFWMTNENLFTFTNIFWEDPHRFLWIAWIFLCVQSFVVPLIAENSSRSCNDESVNKHFSKEHIIFHEDKEVLKEMCSKQHFRTVSSIFNNSILFSHGDVPCIFPIELG